MTVAVLESLTFGLGRLVRAADALGERLLLLTRDPGYYAHELAGLPAGTVEPGGALEVAQVETFDADAVAERLKRVPRLRGLISSTDTWMLVGVEVAERCGLPGAPPEVLRLLRDKPRVRDRLHAAGLSRGRATPLAVGAPEPGLLARFAAEVGFPAVVKDTAGTASQNVWLVRDERELERALREAAEPDRALFGGVFAEPFLAGPVYSAETLTWRGRTRLLGVSSRLMSREPLFREEVTAFPVAFPPDQLAALERWLGRVLAAVGYSDRFAHLEFALTREGPEVVEINPRIGGALVAEGMCRALGYDVYRAMVETALDRRPELIDAELPGGPAVAFVLAYPDRPGTLTGVDGLERLAELPGSPAWYPTKRPGARLEHLTDGRGYAGIVYAEAETAELATHRAVAAANGITVRTEPSPDP